MRTRMNWVAHTCGTVVLAASLAYAPGVQAAGVGAAEAPAAPQPADAAPPVVRAFAILTDAAEGPAPASGSGEGVMVRTASPADAVAWLSRVGGRGRGALVPRAPVDATTQRPLWASPAGPAPAGAGAGLHVGEECTLGLGWPDDAPRSYLEPIGDDTYRRVRLTDTEGYEITLRASAAGGGGFTVDLAMARMVFVGGAYDGSVAAVVGKPTLAKSVCSTVVPVSTAAATFVTWPAPTAGDSLSLLQATMAAVRPAGSPGRATLPGLAMVLLAAEAGSEPLGEGTVQYGGLPLPGLSPFGSEAALAPSGGMPGDGSMVEVRCDLVRVPIASPEWERVLDAEDLAPALRALVDQGSAICLASPRLLIRDGETGWAALGALDGAADVSSESGRGPGLRSGVAVTPRVRGDGRLAVIVEMTQDGLMHSVDARGRTADAVGTSQGAVELELEDGGTGVVGGLLGMAAGGEPDGNAAGVPTETFALVEARVAQANDAAGGFRTGAANDISTAPPLTGESVAAPGVAVGFADPGVAPELVKTIADIVSIARATVERLFPERRLAPNDAQTPNVPDAGDAARPRAETSIWLNIVPARLGYHDSVVTDRRSTIYIRVSSLGIGEVLRPDASPVAILCEAVAEFYNPPQLPGFCRFIAHRYLTTAVYEQLGRDILVDHRTAPLAPDGDELLAIATSADYASVHPDWAAVAALLTLEARLGPEAVLRLTDGVPADAADPLLALRGTAIARDPALDEAFALHDEATRIEPDETGTCLVASFEPFEWSHPAEYMSSAIDGFLFRLVTQNTWAATDAWATDGTQSLCVQADAGAPWMSLYLSDPDWKYRDWRRFSKLEMDLMVEATNPVGIGICVQDHPSCGHGVLWIFGGTLEPGQPVHVSFALDEKSLRGARDMDATYFSGAFRTDSVSRLYIGVGKPTELIKLYIDNIRLTPKVAAP